MEFVGVMTEFVQLCWWNSKFEHGMAGVSQRRKLMKNSKNFNVSLHEFPRFVLKVDWSD